MPIQKSDMRAGADRAVAGARARLAAVLEEPAVLADGGAVLAEAMQTSDYRTAMQEAQRLAALHPQVGEAWKGLDEALKFYSFSLLTDMGNGAE